MSEVNVELFSARLRAKKGEERNTAIPIKQEAKPLV